MIIRTGIGQDSHRFLSPDTAKPCVLGGFIVDGCPGLQANSDGDVIFHAICNAISSLTTVLILGTKADEMLKNEGITDSRAYLEEALKTLQNQKITHVAITLEGARPRILKFIPAIRQSIADVMKLDIMQIGLTATSGEGLTDFGCGIGIQCFAIVTTQEE